MFKESRKLLLGLCSLCRSDCCSSILPSWLFLFSWWWLCGFARCSKVHNGSRRKSGASGSKFSGPDSTWIQHCRGYTNKNFKITRLRCHRCELVEGERESEELQSDENKASTERKKNKRRLKIPSQIMALEKFYNEHKYPTEEMKQDLAEELGLTEKQISGWFCHIRLKDKQLLKDEAIGNG
ncbi:hypothetical protein HN51_039184 [Arachis hypogaea]|uniref:segmentation polarity homeobox protein engrailed n=1 Tax=Arachis ipaensis TaxID=130454 RepID=UPI0007AF7F0B|nr:segmentation polarity homeobox protein engrailed [Arachis ipaensis]XP_025660690.1 segmentation polarity homeobox protein engrailed [Arachis hypogaea]QHN84657.1 uncharacterized protein DS421_16g530580 [Arachis hypogaea]